MTGDIISRWGSAPLEEPDCDLCGSAERVTLAVESFAGHEFRVVECRRCKLAYSCPRPSPEMRAQLHDPQVRNALVDAGIIAARHRLPEGSPTIYTWESQQAHAPNYRRGLALLARVGARGPLLDVGCAGGLFVHMAREAGYEAAGCDVIAAQIEYGVREVGLDLRVGELADLALPDCAFGVVTLWDVIEHVRAPSELIREAARILRPGGHLLLRTPNFALRRLDCRLGLVDRPERYRLASFEHIYHYTPASLRRLLVGAGLGDVRFSVDSDDASQEMRARVRRGLARALFRVTGGRCNFHMPLLAVARRPEAGE